MMHFFIDLKQYKDISEVKLLMADCMSAGEDRVHRALNAYWADESRELLGVMLQEELVGLMGLLYHPQNVVELKHMAVKSPYRSKGIGKAMIQEYIKLRGVTSMKAETDQDAVGFYSKLGFSIKSLGEKYPGVERFECRFVPRNVIHKMQTGH